MTEAGWTPDQVKAFVEAVLAEKDRALGMAGDEREKAASALRGEVRRAEDAAARERERAAESMRSELSGSIREASERLREHIASQVAQIREAIESADRLEIARVSEIASSVRALSDKVDLLREVTELAQDKFEATVQRDSVKQNEFRGSLDDLGKTMATRRETESSFGSVNAKIDELSKQVGELRSRLDTGPPALRTLQSRSDESVGEKRGTTNTWGSVHTLVTVGISVIAVILVIATFVISNQ